jgi:hypothetical protein
MSAMRSDVHIEIAMPTLRMVRGDERVLQNSFEMQDEKSVK